MKVIYGRRRVELATLQADADFERLKEPAIALGTGLPEKGRCVRFSGLENFREICRTNTGGR
jgi:hypothetical protein